MEKVRPLFDLGISPEPLFVVPFLAGHSLHSHWDSFGKYLVLLSMTLLLIATYCAALWWIAWRALLDVKKAC